MSDTPSFDPADDSAAQRGLARRRFRDRLARAVVTTGGLAIIAFILAILAFIGAVVWPLTQGAEVAAPQRRADALAGASAILTDEYNSQMLIASREGWLEHRDRQGGGGAVRRLDLATGRELAAGESPTRTFSVLRRHPATDVLAGITDRGETLLLPLRFATEFLADGGRSVKLSPPEPRLFPPPEDDPARGPDVVSGVLDREGSGYLVTQRGNEAFRVTRIKTTYNEFQYETKVAISHAERPAAGASRRILVDRRGQWLYALRGDRELLAYDLSDPDRAPTVAVIPGAEITAFAFLNGESSLLIGQSDGTIQVWMRVRDTPDTRRALARVRDFHLEGEAVVEFASARRSKGFMAFDRAGRAGLYFNTSERELWKGETGLSDPVAAVLAPREDAFFALSDQGVASAAIDNPHPDAGWKAFFGRIWYEGYDEPQYAWQSSASSDDYESKLSMVPLIVGTLKGTFWSLLLAVPLAVLAALYTSQFLHPAIKSRVKPIIEVMASLPSVVLGFIGGLWLAPRIERVLPGVFAMVIILPIIMLMTGWAWDRLPAVWRARSPRWGETALHMVTLVLGIALAIALSGPLDDSFFGGNYKAWLNDVVGLEYDQRNAIIIAIAMGFAVIPIIYTISEDAFSNVPRSLMAGSRAMGATAWRTASRVVLPTASPGIFSATMVGFGRAVGETMIVLMATGNTPLMDWNPFTGFRTLAANIAVEIPEAPVEGTLYRALFLAALMLFVLTFLVNTVAEIVRERLRQKFGRL